VISRLFLRESRGDARFSPESVIETTIADARADNFYAYYYMQEGLRLCGAEASRIWPCEFSL
jgi:hypothetical protein